MTSLISRSTKNRYHLLRIIGQRESQKAFFSSLAKEFRNDDDSESNGSYDYAATIISPAAISTKNDLQRYVVNTPTTNSMAADMPRLNELRQRLALDKNIPSLKSIKAAQKKHGRDSKTTSSTSSEKYTSDVSWREIVKTAKKEMSKLEDVDLLTDSYSRKHSYLRISLGERCNLRCLYCMPPEGVPLQENEKLLNAHEISRLVELFSAKGVDKVSILFSQYH